MSQDNSTNAGSEEDVGKSTLISEIEENTDKFTDISLSLRCRISFYLVQALQSPARKQWGDRDEIIKRILEFFNLPSNKERVIERVLNEIKTVRKDMTTRINVEQTV